MGWKDWFKKPRQASQELLERHRADVQKRREIKLQKLEHQYKEAKLKADIRKARQTARPSFGFGRPARPKGKKGKVRYSKNPLGEPAFDMGMSEDERIRRAFL